MKNQYKITEDLMRSWAKEYHMHGGANVFLFILWCVFGVIGVIGLILSIAVRGDWMTICLYAVVIFAAFFKLFIQRFIVWSKRYKMYSTTYGVTEWIRTAEFLEDEIVLTDHTSVSKFKYENIQTIKEKNNVVMIFFNNHLALRLYKDAFLDGTWDECEKMILEKKNREKKVDLFFAITSIFDLFPRLTQKIQLARVGFFHLSLLNIIARKGTNERCCASRKRNLTVGSCAETKLIFN